MQKVEGEEKIIVAGMHCCWLEARKEEVSFEDTTAMPPQHSSTFSFDPFLSAAAFGQ